MFFNPLLSEQKQSLHVSFGLETGSDTDLNFKIVKVREMSQMSVSFWQIFRKQCELYSLCMHKHTVHGQLYHK